MTKEGGRQGESCNNKTQSQHYSLDVFSVCVFFNQKPQIAATQKNDNQPPRAKQRERQSEREREGGRECRK